MISETHIAARVMMVMVLVTRVGKHISMTHRPDPRLPIIPILTICYWRSGEVLIYERKSWCSGWASGRRRMGRDMSTVGRDQTASAGVSGWEERRCQTSPVVPVVHVVPFPLYRSPVHRNPLSIASSPCPKLSMGNVMAATVVPPPSVDALRPGDVSKRQGRGNPGPMEELHKRCKGLFHHLYNCLSSI